MNLVAIFLRNPVKISVGVLIAFLFGFIALTRMPVQLVPEVQRPVITIRTTWPGASPHEVEREIVQEQEEQLKGVEGVLKMTSESMDSMAQITLEFGVKTDIPEALLKVNTRLQQVRQYPVDADEPVISTSGSNDRPIAWFILMPRVSTQAEIGAWVRKHPDLREALAPAVRVVSDSLRLRRLEDIAKAHPEVKELLPTDVDVPELKRFAEDHIEARLERVSGVSNVNVLGGEEDELQVVVDPRRLAARDVTIPQLRIALAGHNQDTSAGDFWEGKRRYVVRTLGQYGSPEEVANTVIAKRNGVSVYVRDVASVRMGFKKPEARVFNYGRPCMAINAVRETGANVLEVMKGLKAGLKELNDGILKDRGLELNQAYDETEYINSAIDLVDQNIILGGILTTIVLLLFLRSVRSTLIVALAIPTSVVGTFLLLGLMGRSLNVVSLAGMAFAVGMLVDNAIVVLENIFRRYQMGEPRQEAAIRGTAEVWGAVVSSTLTTLAVFVPILFLKDEAGQLFSDIALAISCAIGLSLVVSVVVIPTATARILPKRNRHAESGQVRENELDLNVHVPRFLLPLVWPLDALGRGSVALVAAAHRWLQRGVLRQLVFAGALIAGSVLLALRLMPKKEYLPTGNQNMAIAIILPPPGYNLNTMTQIGQEIDARIKPYWDVSPHDPVQPKLDYPAIGQYFFVAYGRQLFMGARARDPMAVRGVRDLLNRAVSGIPGAIGFAQQTSLFEQGLTGARSIDIEIRGPDLKRLVGIGQRVMGQASAMYPRSKGGQVRPIPSLDLSSPEVHVIPQWEQAAAMGVSAVDLGYTVNSLVDGAYAGDYFFGGNKIDLTIMGAPRFAEHLQDLKDLALATPSGNLVPLSALARIELSSGPEQINHRERERAITIEMSPPDNVALEDAIDRVKREIVEPLREDGTIGGDYRITLGGTADKLTATLGEMSMNLLLALVITYLLMAALFESWLYPFVVITSVPLGAVGGLLGLAVLNLFVPQKLDILTMLGFVILIGTVVNNAILIVHQALNYIREEEMTPKDAVLLSTKTRMRPIFMTLLTTVFGLAPLVLFPGAGSELYRGIGSILIGGLFVSTVFTLFLIPTLFRLTMSVRTFVMGALFGRP